MTLSGYVPDPVLSDAYSAARHEVVQVTSVWEPWVAKSKTDFHSERRYEKTSNQQSAISYCNDNKLKP